MKIPHSISVALGSLLAICLLVCSGCGPTDLCAGVNCEEGETCDANTGQCVAEDLCEGVTCEEGETCDPNTGQCVAEEPEEFTNASAANGGVLYDKWWVVAREAASVDAPTEDHPFWASQDTNTREGADTWRCKECHGWDYKGVDGAYGSGSHMTGFAGIFGTTLSAQEVFDTIKDDHSYGNEGLGDEDIWDLAKFVLEGPIDTDDIIDAGGAFTGSASAGQSFYDSTCAACHGTDGLSIPPGADEDHDDWVGKIANENPWEFQHKVRFGQPDTAMPPQVDILTTAEVGDLGAHAQTLPTSDEPEGFTSAIVGNGGLLYDKWWVVAREATSVDAPTEDHPFWASQDTNTRTGADTWRCKECHGWDYKGVDGAYGSGSHMTGFAGIFGTALSAQDVFDLINTDHGFGDAGLGDEDIWDLAKFVLEGQIDTDDIMDADGMFTGDAGTGQTLYDEGIGTNIACAVCHGADGTTIDFGDGEFIGGLADGNPWEFQHKVRFGHPGTAMPAGVDVDATNDDVADVGTYSQTLE